jgi:peptidoglycan/xylan/chitin deacetylase (PgdA/CDA1 family)
VTEETGGEEERRMTKTERLKYTLKVVIAHLLYVLGLLRLCQMIRMRQRAVVLMYHRVLDRHDLGSTGSHPALIVTRESFRRQMAALRRWFTILSLEEFAERMERGIPFDDSSCLITFDDGWVDNFDNALPVLRQYELPAVVFLPTSYIGERRLFWQEALTHLLIRVATAVRDEPARRPRFSELLTPHGLEHLLELPDHDPRAPIVSAIGSQKRASVCAVSRLLAALTSELGLRIDELGVNDGFISWDQVKAMSSQGIEFGAHGAEHRLLTEVPPQEAREEIRASREVLRAKSVETVPAFCYPNGYLASDIVDMVRAAGYRLAFTTEDGLVSCGDDVLRIPRLSIHECVSDSTPMFLARLVGLF